ncbi:MAG: S-layer homology domain-containing protein [Oscillospiraceae bacterium]
MKKRILSLLLVFVMLLSLLPAGVLAAEGDVSVTLSGMHDAQVKSLKLYTYMDGVKGADDLLAAKEAADGAYTIDLAPGAYWVDGYDANNDRNGGVVIDVSSDSSSFKLQRMYQISVNPSAWVKDTDYTLSLRVTDASGAERKAEFGTAVNWGTTYASCLFVVGDTVSVTATPNAETHPNYNPATASKTPTMNDSLSLTCKEFVTVTVTAPKGSTIDAGTLAKYYVFSFLEPFARSVEDGTATFHLDKNTDYFYRVRHPQGATYWNYVRLSADAAYTVTEEDLGLTGDFSKSTIYHFENNVYDRAGIYLNINTKGYKNMAVGETFELNSFRNWFAIESFMNAKVALPEMHYQVIDVNGNASDVVTITPNALNSNVAVMEAKHEGTAIVLVTYDAMTHMAGQTSTASHRFSAIWPELTGVFVVNVGADGSAIQTNMNLDRMDAVIEKDEARQLDAEHDILFYTGTEGASYSFKPEAGCTVSVLRPTVTAASMTYSGGFTNTGVTTAEDGTVTVSGLITGRNIIKVTKGGLSTYQVVTARGVSYKFVNAEGTELTQEELAAIKPGDSVTIQFSNLISPKEKLSGAYNFNFSLYMQGPDGTFFKSDPGGNFGVYDFSGNPERQKLTVTIPKFWAEETYTLSGAIKQAGWPGVPTHRGITYAVGTNPGFDAPKTAGILSRLPEITIPVVKLDFLTGKLSFQDQNGTAIDRKDLTVTLADSAGNGIAVAEDGTFKAYAEEYFYTVSGAGVEYATGSVTMKEEGSNEFTITLQATAAGAWDGKTQTEPQTDENGVYQIGTGAELAWFVAKSKDADVSGVLTADINLGKYAWLNISSSKKVVLDGASFEITGLNATAGLFAQIGSNSYIHDLTIRGAVSGKGSAGAIAGYASGTAPKIANCFNYAVITSTGNNVGGLVGYTYQNAVIENCANFGAVTGGSSVGGIIGGTVSNGSTITGCYNTAEISATGSKAGGIIGGTSSEMTVTSCYNTGKISGTASGGIAGEVKGNVNWSGTVQGKITISSCYSTGEAGSAVFGTVDTASSEISKCYYLNTLAADANAEALNEADLKDADLSDAFGPVCGGYPALRWQTDVTFHEVAGEGTVTAPLCTVKGYTSYSCSKCGKSYRTAYTAPLGHDFCEDLDGSDNSCVLTAPTCTQPGKIVRTCRRDGCSETKEDIVPAKGHTPKDGTEQVFTGYKTYECAVCGETYTVWDDDRLGHVSYPEQTVTSISVSDNGNYPWVYNADLDRFESSNQEQDKTSSTTSFAFTLSAPTVLRFGYGVSSENGYDKLTITLAEDGGSTETLADAVSGEKSGSIKKQLAAGSYTLTLSYVKDDASKGGSDMAYVSVLTLAGMARVIVENTTFPKAEGAVWEGTLADTWIELTGESTMMGCVVEALDGHTVVGAESNYISSIDNLKAFDGGTMSGWMGTLNDWFTNFGFGEFTVAKGTLCAGDEIRIMYTRTVEDLGGSWNNSDTRLKALTFSTGKLAPKFSGDTFTYTLTVPEGTTSLLVTPTAANKNYQVRAYLGTQATGREYSRTSLIPIANGSVITVVCADDSWPTMNETSDGKRTYTINVVFGTAQSSDAGVASVKVADVEAAAGENNAYTVTVPYGTAITADSFVIALSDNKAGVTAGPTEGESGVWSFTVTAEDGTAVTYTVTVTVAEAPKSSDAGVTSVSVAHTPASKTGETTYTVKLQTNAEVTADSFQIVPSDEKASVSAPTANGDVWTFTVTAEDGTTTAAYTVTVTRRSASETTPLRTVTLSMLRASLEDTTTRSFTLHQTAGSNVLTSPYRIVSGASGIQFQVKVSYNTAYSAVYAFTTTDGTAKAVDAPHAKNVAIINPDLSGSLVAVITLTNKTDASDVWVYELRMPTEANHAPRLKDGVITPAAASINLGESYQFDMTQIFEDEDAYDKLTYRVWRDAENPFYVPASYSYTPSAAGTYTLVFKASDGKAESPEYKFVLTVIDPNAKSSDAGVASVKVAGVEAAAGTAENSFSVTLPAGTEVTADSFEITLSDDKASVTAGPTEGESGVWTFTVTAEDGTAVTYSVTVTVKEAKTIHATISMQAENMFIMVPTRVEVSSDLAERYGYADDVTDGVSALDVLVKYHELTFGEDFTKDSKSDYLVVSNGTITTVNGEKTSAFSFAVNGEFPCDKNGEYNTQYGYTGYTISQTPVAEDGTVEFFFYQDTSMYMDYYTWFTDTDGNRLDTFTVQAGTDFTLGMDGYMYAYGGGLKPEDRVTHGAALDPEDIQICTVGEDGTLTPVEGKVIGENGQVTLSFAAAGSYVLSAMGDEFTNIFSPWLPVTVTAAPKSNDANVSSITVAGVEATAGENNTYTVTLPYGTDVTAGSFVIVTSDAGATVGALTNEGNVWTFTVTAEDRVTSKTYTVTVSFTEAPKSNDANVSSVTVAGVEATAGENNTYTVTLPYGTDVTAGSFVIVTSDAGATVGALTNEGNVWTFTVTAEDRVTSKTYTVTVSFTEAPKSNDAGVSSITVAGFKAVAGANNSYTVTVPYGTVVKTGSFVIVTRHPRATVSALTNTRNIWSFTVTAEDGVTTAVYTVTVNTAALPEPITPGVDNKKPASKPEVKLPFTDVSTSDWFYDDVAFVYKNGLFSGTDSRSFSPNASMTRAMLVTVLYRLEGEPTVTGRSSFTDVRSGAYYEKSVIWAAANGIVTGTDSTSFSPDAKVTREQLAAILYRYAQYRKLDTDASAKLNSFTDADSVSAYASEALGWAVSEGLINGASGKLMPKGDATRAQVAAILHRLVKNVLN